MSELLTAETVANAITALHRLSGNANVIASHAFLKTHGETVMRVLQAFNELTQQASLHADQCAQFEANIVELQEELRIVMIGRDSMATTISAYMEREERAYVEPPEVESDRICQEADGCPTETAVLKRFWREHHFDAEFGAVLVGAGFLDRMGDVCAEDTADDIIKDFNATIRPILTRYMRGVPAPTQFPGRTASETPDALSGVTDPAKLPPDIKHKLRLMMTAFHAGDHSEAHHWLYAIACPGFNCYDPYAPIEGRTCACGPHDINAGSQIPTVEQLQNMLDASSTDKGAATP